jgi:hypothetical protein
MNRQDAKNAKKILNEFVFLAFLASWRFIF